MRIQDHRYRNAPALEQLCGLLDINVSRVLRRANLPGDFLRQTARGPTAQQYFDVWNAVCAESDRPDLALFLGRAFATGPFNTAVFAFSNSADVLSGLHRLALFKPLIGPCRFDVTVGKGQVDVAIRSAWPDYALPVSMHALEIVYVLENIRHGTKTHVIPLSIRMPCPEQVTPRAAAFFGIMPERSDTLGITISAQDAGRALVVREQDQLAWIEPDPKWLIGTADAIGTATARVKLALTELLPAGLSSVADVSRHLRLSSRTLQRQLAAEATTYQSVLNETRCDLALRYLRRDGISIDEIAYLLAYSTPNSFYRAFRGWTGKTPHQARQGSL